MITRRRRDHRILRARALPWIVKEIGLPLTHIWLMTIIIIVIILIIDPTYRCSSHLTIKMLWILSRKLSQYHLLQDAEACWKKISMISLHH